MIRLNALWCLPLLALALVATASACGDDDDDGSATATPNDGATVVEQGTVANLGNYRVGVVSVDVENRSAFVSILRAEGEKEQETTLVVGTPLELPDGTLELLAAEEGGDERDTIRLRFTPD